MHGFSEGEGARGDTGARGNPPAGVARRVPRTFPVFAVLFLLMAVFNIQDIVADVAMGHRGLHMVLEAISLVVAVFGLVAAAREFYGVVRRAEELQGDLQRSRADVERWRRETEVLLARLGHAIDDRFDAWGLTDAEREIAVFVLKGLSYKEVASARGTSERTVRHQALAIYRKAGVAGRAEMAAHFLETMLSPQRPSGEGDPQPAADVPPVRAPAASG